MSKRKISDASPDSSSQSTSATAAPAKRLLVPVAAMSEEHLRAEVTALRVANRDLEQLKRTSLTREKTLMVRLTQAELQCHKLRLRIHELEESISDPTNGRARKLLDPMVHFVFTMLQNQSRELEDKAKQLSADRDAWQFQAESAMGKKLMARCRQLIEENQELGKQLCDGRVAQLAGALSMSQALVTELRKSDADLRGIVVELEEDMGRMLDKAAALKKELKAAKSAKEIAEKDASSC